MGQTYSTYNSGWTASDTEYLLYDGHGSTRQLINWQGYQINPAEPSGIQPSLSSKSFICSHPGRFSSKSNSVP